MKNQTFTRIMALVLALVMALSCLAGIVLADEVNPGANTVLYSSDAFEAAYYYDGDDLGAVWSVASTTFRVWAPTAESVKVNLYTTGHPEANDMYAQVEMTADVGGTWGATVEGDLNGVYYAYEVNVDGRTNIACDPYARTTGVNGKRAMVIDLDSTDPEGWDQDKDPHYDDSGTETLGTVEGTVTVDAISACVLVKEPVVEEPAAPDLDVTPLMTLYVALGALAVVAIAGIVAILLSKKKK